MKKQHNYKITSVFIIIFLSLILIVSFIAILRPATGNTTYIADIYQDGNLLSSIPLDDVTVPYSFTVTGINGCVNEIEVRSGSIGIISADCPDKLCVHQGFISNNRLPIVCLPNRLVIQLRESDFAADIVTY